MFKKIDRLDSVAVVDLSGVDKKITPGQQLVRLCNFVDVYHNWAITKDMRDYFMEASANAKEISRFLLHKGQVALTKDSETRDDIGIATYIADDFDDVILGYHNALITPDERQLNGKYLNAFLHSQYALTYFANKASGSGQRYTLSKEVLNEMPIFVPDTIEEQERIGELFSTIDKKIALNKSVCRKLEQSAKDLHNYYYNNTQFSQSGWREVSLNEIIERKISGDWGTEEPSSKNTFKVSCARGADMKDLTHLPTRYIKYKEETLLGDGDIVVEISGGSPTQSTGRSVLITEDVMARFNDRVICSNFCRGLRFKNSLHGYFYFLVFKSLYDTGCFFNYEGKTSGLHNLDIDAFLENKIRIPSDDELTAFSLKLKSLYSQISTLETENLNLIKERDYLLPLLMSDQLSIIE